MSDASEQQHQAPANANQPAEVRSRRLLEVVTMCGGSAEHLCTALLEVGPDADDCDVLKVSRAQINHTIRKPITRSAATPSPLALGLSTIPIPANAVSVVSAVLSLNDLACALEALLITAARIHPVCRHRYGPSNHRRAA